MKLNLFRGKGPRHFSEAAQDQTWPETGHLRHVFDDSDFHSAETITVLGFDSESTTISRRSGIFGKVRKPEEIQSDIAKALGDEGEWAQILFARPPREGWADVTFKELWVRNPEAGPVETLDMKDAYQ